jgi:hypothetical protein
MKTKDAYTFEELCTGLTIPLTKFCQMAGITEPTLIRLRKGYSGRQHTINSILATFSQIYGIDLDLSNVSGLTVQDKPHQKDKKPSVSVEASDDTTPTVTSPPLPSVEPQKRAYTKQREKKSTLPDGCINATEFARIHEIPRGTFNDHMTKGLGAGLIGTSTDTIPQRDQVDYSERQKPNRPTENEKYLTSDQQERAIRFWKRHDVAYVECNDFGCWCHTVKNGA